MRGDELLKIQVNAFIGLPAAALPDARAEPDGGKHDGPDRDRVEAADPEDREHDDEYPQKPGARFRNGETARFEIGDYLPELVGKQHAEDGDEDPDNVERYAHGPMLSHCGAGPWPARLGRRKRLPHEIHN